MKPSMPVVCALALVGACVEPGTPEGSTGTETTTGEPPLPGYPELDGPCALDPPNPRRLIVTTTDFATGAVSWVDLDSGVLTNDVALATPDAIPHGFADRIYLVNRFQYDYVDVLDPSAAWASLGQFAVPGEDVASTNPHSITIGPDGLGYVVLFGAPEVRVLDFNRAPDDARVGSIDLSPFADADGNPEGNVSVLCGTTLFVGIQRLDPSFEAVDYDALVAIDVSAQRALDLDPDTPGAQAIELGGRWLRQLRRDPTDPAGHTVLGLTTGIERIDLTNGQVSWVVDPEAFASAGIDGYLLPQSFDVSADGLRAFVAAYTSSFSEVRLYEVGLDGAAPAVPEPFASGFDSVEHTLEVVGDRLWYGSSRLGAPGLWTYDTTTVPPSGLDDAPRSTGLPPYSMTVSE